MKNRIIIYSFLAVSAVLAMLAPQIAKRTAPLPDGSAPEISSEYGYVLREYEGVIGVFKAGVSEPISVIEVDTRTLPERDRAALILGVYAADDEELNRRIEDYSS
ncbi:MAG: hypothetical protein IJL83_03485 [Clostridia bacterium]|nr:hypothetical protein [Clostridia bacterium]